MSFEMVRTVHFKNAVAMAAGMPVAAEIVAYLREKGIKARLLVPQWSGLSNRAVMVTTSDDLTQAQQRVAKVMAEEKFAQLLKRFTEYVDGSKTSDQLWRVID